MSASDILLSAGGSESKLYVDDVFSTYLYTGNGSTQTINNGIDLAGKGGMVWTKKRSAALNHALYDTARGTADGRLESNTTSGKQGTNEISSFNSNGYTIAANTNGYLNDNTAGTYVSWTFRKAPKFFDVVTYTGNGVEGRQIPHSLGVAPGMIVVKETSDTSNWVVYHRSLGSAGDKYLFLNTTDSAGSPYGGVGFWGGDPTTTHIVLGGDSVVGTGTNLNGVTYVAYLFAHDSSADGIIQCGSFTTDGSGNATVNLGWEPQYLLRKVAVGSNGLDWKVVDIMRKFDNGSPSSVELCPNSSSTESNWNGIKPTSTGFTAGDYGSQTYIYLAIRRPNKPPVSGTQVYNAIARTGTQTNAKITGVGFTPDVLIGSRRTTIVNMVVKDKLRGIAPNIFTNSSDAENNSAANVDLISFDMDGVSLGPSSSTSLNTQESIINHFFRRAPGFMDVVCHSGDGVMASPIQHGLGVKPQLAITKCRSTSEPWAVTFDIGTGIRGVTLNSTAAHQDTSHGWHFLMGNQFWSQYSNIGINTAGQTYVTYLFASLPGISKVGSYTGNGTSQTINCGFTTGARFILIKRTDSTGDWYVWDTARGIVAANDPHLSLNTTAVEVTTDDSVDPEATGFIVNQVAATNINVNGGSYIFLAIA